MTLFQALLLGMVQGLTEFLPISSSAHLVFFQHLFGFKDPLVFFDVVLHLGTLMALCVYFAGDLAHLIRDSIYGIGFVLRGKSKAEIYEIAPYGIWAYGIVIATIPTALIGFIFKDWFEGLFGSLRGVGIQLLINAAILGSTLFFEKGAKGIKAANLIDYLFIGVLQGISIIPGISRSGTTVAAGLYRGFEREAAFRFAFLLAIPAILGAAVLELRGVSSLHFSDLPPLLLGFLASAVSGFFAIRLLSAVIRKGKLHDFAFYSLAFGVVVLWASR